MLATRTLTEKQHQKLDLLARADRNDPEETAGLDPGAKIIGYLGGLVFMPIILRSDGRKQKLQPGGRLTVLRKEEEEDA